MASPITDLVKNQIYPNLDAVKSGLLDELNPKKQGEAYSLNCPECGAVGRAFYYPGRSHIVCNRKNNCGAAISIWDYLQSTGMSKRDSLQAMADAAGVGLPDSGEANSEKKDIDKVKKALRYGYEKSGRAQEYMTQKRGWREDEMKNAPFGYIHKFEYFMGGLERLGVSPSFIERCGFREIEANENQMRMFEQAIVGWWEQPDGTLRLWARDVTGHKHVKYYYQPGTHKDWPCYWNERVNAASREHLVLVEGVLDAARLLVNGIPAVAIGGASVSERQAAFISTRLKSFTHWIDTDEAGYKGGMQTVIKASKYGLDSLVFVPPQESDAKDADELLGYMSADGVADMIAANSIGGGRFLAEGVIREIKKGQGDMLALFDRARQVSASIKGMVYSEFMQVMQKKGVYLENPISESLKVAAELINSGISAEDAFRAVKRRYGITISVTTGHEGALYED